MCEGTWNTCCYCVFYRPLATWFIWFLHAPIATNQFWYVIFFHRQREREREIRKRNCSWSFFYQHRLTWAILIIGMVWRDLQFPLMTNFRLFAKESIHPSVMVSRTNDSINHCRSLFRNWPVNKLNFQSHSANFPSDNITKI